MNYPSVKTHHNNFEIYLGSLLKKEKKFLNFNAVVILNNPNVSLSLPLLEINIEYLTLKNNKESFMTKSNGNNGNNLTNFNNLSHLLLNSGSNNLFKNKSTYYSISIPIITRNKEVSISNSVILRSCCSKIADKLNESLEFVKK